MSNSFCESKLATHPTENESLRSTCGNPDQKTVLEEAKGNSDACKFLGIYLDSQRTLRERIPFVEEKLNSFYYRVLYKVRRMYRTKNFFPKSLREIRLYKFSFSVRANALKMYLQCFKWCQLRFLRTISFQT